MNKADLIEAVADRAALSPQVSAAVVRAFQKVVVEELSANRPVVIAGFGTFSVHQRPARNGRHPATGASLEIPASTVVNFKAGAVLKRFLS